MKKKIENDEREKTLNQDRFGFSKEESGRSAIKPRNIVPKNFETGKDQDGGPHKGN